MNLDFRHLAYLVEKQAPQEYSALRARFPAARILVAAKKLGAERPTDDQPSLEDQTAALDFCRVGLRLVAEQTDKLMKRVRARMRSARRFRVFGAVLTMASSAGLAASTLELISVDQKIVGLTLSGVAFLGGVTALTSDELAKGGPSGTDVRTLFDRLVGLQGMIASAKVRIDGKSALGAFQHLDALSDLNEAAAELTRLQSLHAIA